MREAVLVGELPIPDVDKMARRQEVLASRDDEDADELRWNFVSSSYQISYTDEGGWGSSEPQGPRSRQE